MRATSFMIFALVLLCAAVQGQSLLDAPSATVDAANATAPSVRMWSAIESASAKPAASISEPHSKIIDKKFMLLNGLVLATTTADMELTQHCQNAGTCVELNPTIPRARWAKHMINVPTNAAVMYWSYRWKKQGKKLWWVPPLVDVAIHSVGIGSNIRFAF